MSPTTARHSRTPPVFDGHNDLLLRLYFGRGKSAVDFWSRNNHGHIDFPRAKRGRFAGGFFAIMAQPVGGMKRERPRVTKSGYHFPLASPVDPIHAHDQTMAIATRLFRLESESDGRLKVVQNARELASCIRTGTLAAVLHFEGAEAIHHSLDDLEVFYRAGLRSLGLVWSRPNAFAHGVPFRFPHSPNTGPGLTPAGKALIRECNRLGIMVDLSHLNEKGFWDVAKISEAPLVATHSNAHALCQQTRNLTDRQLDAIKESDGMVGVNFAVSFLRADGGRDPATPLSEIVRHVDYLVDRVGINRVGFGSDFDGAGIPAPLKDVAGLPKLLSALAKSGYDSKSLRKIAYENWLRVLRKTWRS
jgi:membrane dipeptidase